MVYPILLIHRGTCPLCELISDKLLSYHCSSVVYVSSYICIDVQMIRCCFISTTVVVGLIYFFFMAVPPYLITTLRPLLMNTPFDVGTPLSFTPVIVYQASD